MLMQLCDGVVSRHELLLQECGVASVGRGMVVVSMHVVRVVVNLLGSSKLHELVLLLVVLRRRWWVNTPHLGWCSSASNSTTSTTSTAITTLQPRMCRGCHCWG